MHCITAEPCRLLLAIILCRDLKSCLQNEAFTDLIDQRSLFFILLHSLKELTTMENTIFKKSRNYFKST